MPDEIAPDTPTPRGKHLGPSSSGSSMSRTWLIALVVAAVVLVGAGIALAVSVNHKTNPPQKVLAPLATTTTAVPTASTATCPLSGLSAPGGSVPPRPALAIKVDNYPQARPQAGLDKADVVFEEPVEGGITRLVAVFQCQGAGLVGPIRSARAVDAQILDELSDPIFIHAGGIPPVISLVEHANDIDDNVFTHGSIVQNPAGRYAPYDTYASTAAAWGLDPHDTTPPAPIFTYSTTTPAGMPATSVHIPFSGTSNVTWTWNADSGHWLLSYSGTPATVADGNQIAVTNIVVETVHVTYGPWYENTEGGLEVQSQLTGSGPLVVLRNGVSVTGTWSRASLSDPTSLLAADGSTIAMAPGQTWVEIVPSNITVTTTSPATPAG